MLCKKCGHENHEGNRFCSSCGNNILENENIETENQNLPTDINEKTKHEKIAKPIMSFDKLANDKKSSFKDKRYIIGIVLSALVILGISYTLIKPPSAESVFAEVKDYEVKDIAAHLDKVYPADGGVFGLFKVENRENQVKVFDFLIADLNNEFVNTTGMSMEDYNSIKIIKLDIETISYSSDYVNINVTVKNGGKSEINYIKINLFFKNSSGTIVKSDWTNDNSTIKPGASQLITTMVKSEGWESVEAEIIDIK